MTKVFVTGATGYIGGDFLHIAVRAHPDWEIACLVRDPAKGSQLSSVFPHIRIVHGDLLAASTIEAEASKADLVYHFASSDHVKSAQAIAKGLSRNTNPTAFWIHTSGAGILTFQNFARNDFGHALPSDSKVYDDWENIGELTSLPNQAIHRHVDKIVLSTSSSDPDRMKTAIVAPSCIYGVGRGTGNTSSVQVNVAAQIALSAGKGLKVGDGSNTWHEVHIHDLSKLYLALGEAAVKKNSKATWNEKGYYFAENGSFKWGDIVGAIAQEGQKQGFLQSAEVESIDAETAKKYHIHYSALCGTTSRGLAKRARLLLDWEPSQRSMLESIPEIIKQEAAKLKLTPRKKRQSSL